MKAGVFDSNRVTNKMKQSIRISNKKYRTCTGHVHSTAQHNTTRHDTTSLYNPLKSFVTRLYSTIAADGTSKAAAKLTTLQLLFPCLLLR